MKYFITTFIRYFIIVFVAIITKKCIITVVPCYNPNIYKQNNF